MTWWVIPVALATILADAVLDPDTREAVAVGFVRVLVAALLPSDRGVYRPALKVNPRTARPPRGGTAVVPARPWVDPHAWSGVADLTNDEVERLTRISGDPKRRRPAPNQTRPTRRRM